MTWCGSKKSKFTDFQIDCLDAHNSYRLNHGVPLMDLNGDLCKYAEEHAKYLCACDSQKRSKGPYGENIFIKESSARRIYADPYEPVRYWYEEGKSIKPGCEVDLKEHKHYINVLWKETSKLGVGYAMNFEKNKIFVVANYYPKSTECNLCENLPGPRDCPVEECPSTVKII